MFRAKSLESSELSAQQLSGFTDPEGAVGCQEEKYGTATKRG